MQRCTWQKPWEFTRRSSLAGCGMSGERLGFSTTWLVIAKPGVTLQTSNGQIDDMFDHNQYFPVLRWKGAERAALRQLAPGIRNQITPIIEFVPREFEDKSLPATLGDKAKQIAQNWGWRDVLFVDFSLLGDGRAAQAVPVFVQGADQYQLRAGLVTSLSQSPDLWRAIQTALASDNRELCLRVNAYELRRASSQRAIHELLARYARQPSEVHLAIDFQAIRDPLPSLGTWLGGVPDIDDWRSLTVIAGTFPKDLTHLEKNTQHTLPRSDWLAWRDCATSAAGRIPSFGDYAIQHGVFEEREGKLFNFSASIRYTSRESWVIMRGEGVQNEDGPGYAQWPAWAQLLCEREEFCGPEFSYGDGYIYTMSRQLTRTGTAKAWLTAAFNHHLTFVVRQIRNTFAGADNAVAPHFR
jgi:hypothetical protein